ncbi:MAG: hypothetical protein GC161_04065 [Planctomycetaceae bacterium]|nr:hypothetical protein [Planctomycetaceae bacterium]
MSDRPSVMAAPSARSLAGPFGESYVAALLGLRQGLERALRAAGADPSRPQDVSRSFGLNKNLAWKMARLVAATDPAAALRFVPGPAGLRKIRDALSARAGPEATADLDRALWNFDHMVQAHAGDRGTLDILVQGLGHDRLEPETLEQARRLAFQGNSAIWGVQARAQISISILAPNREDPAWVDVVQVGGLVDFRRMRPDVRWLLFSSQSYSLTDGSSTAGVGEPLEPPPEGSRGAPLLAEFCSTPLPHVEVLRGESETRYELPGGTIGNSSLLTCTYGVYTPRVGPRLGDDDDAWAEVGAHLLTPAEHLQTDVLLHRDLGWGTPPELRLLGRLDGRPALSEAERAGRQVPFGERLADLGPGLMGLSSAAIPRSEELVRYALGQLGWDASEFHAWRFSMPFPPVPTSVFLASRLPRR